MMNENDHSFGKKIPETNACKKTRHSLQRKNALRYCAQKSYWMVTVTGLESFSASAAI